MALFKSAARKGLKVPRPASQQPPNPAASAPPIPSPVGAPPVPPPIGAPPGTPPIAVNPAAVGAPVPRPADPASPSSAFAPASGPQPTQPQEQGGEVAPDYDDDELDIPLDEDDEPATSNASTDTGEVTIGLPATPSLSPPALQSVAPLYTPRWTAERVLLGVAFCAIAALTVALVVVMTRSEPGSLTVNVLDPAGANLEAAVVTVDGQSRCRRSPCVVSGLTEGKHKVEVSAPGYEQITEQETTLQSRLRTHLAIRIVGNPATARAGIVTSTLPVEPAPASSAASAAPADSTAPPEGSAEAIASLDAPPPETHMTAAAVPKRAAASKGTTSAKAWSALKASKTTSSKSSKTSKASTSKKKKKKKKKKKVRKIKLQ